MPENDYYPEPSTDSAASDAPKPKKESGEYETFLVPKAAFGERDVNPGESETIEIVHVYEDEIECRCSGDKKDPKKSSMDEAMDEMGSMSEA